MMVGGIDGCRLLWCRRHSSILLLLDSGGLDMLLLVMLNMLAVGRVDMGLLVGGCRDRLGGGRSVADDSRGERHWASEDSRHRLRDEEFLWRRKKGK